MEKFETQENNKNPRYEQGQIAKTKQGEEVIIISYLDDEDVYVAINVKDDIEKRDTAFKISPEELE